MFPDWPCPRRFFGAFCGLTSGAPGFGSDPGPLWLRFSGGTGGCLDICTPCRALACRTALAERGVAHLAVPADGALRCEVRPRTGSGDHPVCPITTSSRPRHSRTSTIRACSRMWRPSEGTTTIVPWGPVSGSGTPPAAAADRVHHVVDVHNLQQCGLSGHRQERKRREAAQHSGAAEGVTADYHGG